jgi:hypothetical protein
MLREHRLPVTIYLSSLPGTYLLAKEDTSSIQSFLLGLAPGGGYLAADITAGAGERLTRLFTLT